MSKPATIRDRIVGFERVKASDLAANPNNWRIHNEAQRTALHDLLGDVGIADALIARKRADGKLELIDGHLRQDTDPEIRWPVLILDVSEEEAQKLLISLDPLAALATADLGKLDLLRGLVESDSLALNALWDAQRLQAMAGLPGGESGRSGDATKLVDRFLVVPFSVLSARDGWWQERKRAWIALVKGDPKKATEAIGEVEVGEILEADNNEAGELLQ